MQETASGEHFPGRRRCNEVFLGPKESSDRCNIDKIHQKPRLQVSSGFGNMFQPVQPDIFFVIWGKAA